MDMLAEEYESVNMKSAIMETMGCRWQQEDKEGSVEEKAFLKGLAGVSQAARQWGEGGGNAAGEATQACT